MIILRENLIIRGILDIEIKTRHGTGWIVERQSYHNLITDAGRNTVKDLLLGSGFGPQAIALGTSATAAAVDQVALGAEVFRGEMTRRLSENKKCTFQLVLTEDDANGNTLNEAGLFNSTADQTGTMLARATYSPIVKNNTIQSTFTWTWEMP